MAVKTYDPKKKNVSASGYNITGWAEGTFIKIARTTKEKFKKHVGATGEVSRTKVADNSGTVTLTLKQTSPANAFLFGLAKLDATWPLGIFSKDDMGLSAVAPNAWIESEPDPELADVEGKCEWVIGCEDISRIWS